MMRSINESFCQVNEQLTVTIYITFSLALFEFRRLPLSDEIVMC